MKDNYQPQTILSSNRKTVIPSLNLTRKNCNPSKLCMKRCYARQGHMSLPVAERKNLWVSDYLKQSDISKLAAECHAVTAVRLCGGGDFLDEHVCSIIRLAEECSETQFWGFTRKPSIVLALNGELPNLYMQLSVDSTTPKRIWEDIKCDISYGPHMQDDEVPEDSRIRVVFPYHFRGRVINGVKPHHKDCQAVWDHSIHCYQCKRCYPVEARQA